LNLVEWVGGMGMSWISEMMLRIDSLVRGCGDKVSSKESISLMRSGARTLYLLISTCVVFVYETFSPALIYQIPFIKKAWFVNILWSFLYGLGFLFVELIHLPFGPWSIDFNIIWFVAGVILAIVFAILI
jgi:hypothetical protein